MRAPGLGLRARVSGPRVLGLGFIGFRVYGWFEWAQGLGGFRVSLMEH